MLQLSVGADEREPVALERKRLTIGRDAENDVVLDHPEVSGFHCEIHRDDQGNLQLVDLGSHNGTLLNGRKVTGRQNLSVWDRLNVGGFELEVEDPEGRRPTRPRPAITAGDDAAGTGVRDGQDDSAWRLVGVSDSVQERSAVLEDELSIGREPGRDLRIDSPDVSRLHARLSLEDGVVTVVDQDSANGTFVNGERVTRSRVRSGDEIRFDEYAFRLRGPAGGETAATRVRPAVDPQSTRVRPAVDAGGGTGSGSGAATTRVMEAVGEKLVATGSVGGGPHALTGRQFSVGRVTGNDIVLDHETVSSHHARLVHEGGRWHVEDQGSTNGTFANGNAVKREALNAGDRVSFGEVGFRLETNGSGQGASGTRVMGAVAPDGAATGANGSEAPTRVQSRRAGVPGWVYGVIGFAVVALGAGLFLFRDTITGTPNMVDAKLQVSSLWTQRLGAQRSQPATPVLADINGDDFLDIVVPDGQGYVMALDGQEGKRIFDAQLSGRIVAPAAASDLSGDGNADLVVATYAGLITAINGQSKVLWQSGRQIDTGAIVNAPAFADLNDDAVRDVVVPTAEQGLVALDGNRGWRLWTSAEITDGQVLSRPLTGDFNNDGARDFISVTERGQVMAVSAQGERVWQLWEARVPSVLYASPLHLRTQGTALVVVATESGVRALNASNGRSAWRVDQGNDFFASPVAVHADDDDIKDVIVTATNGQIFALSGRHGDLIWKTSLGAGVKATPALHDIDGDGRKDLIILDQEGRMHVLTMRKGRVELTTRLADDAAFTASPLLGDVNRDGFLDVVAASEDGRIFTQSFNRSTDKGEAVWPVFTGSLGAVGD